MGFVAAASLPLLHSDKSALGALTVGWATPQRFDIHERALLQTVSLMCAQTIERARLGDLRRHLVESLQHELLPSVPPVPGFSTAVRYIPATTAIGFGGDWYDVIRLRDGRFVAIVGDVAGHGIEAAARMSQVRGAINALARLHDAELGNVFARAEEILEHLDEGYIATIAIFVIDPITGDVDYVSAGHPPAVVITSNGEATLLTGGRRPVLGSGNGNEPVAAVNLAPGAALIAFTDGLVERRDQNTDVGTQRLIAHTAAHAQDLDPESLAAHLIERLIGSRPINDDVALVIIRRDIAC